ncbi:MAG: metalloregulator ArsR/SmtB family transcription factor [Pseudomonadota bacterium]|jgi:ArsR family transcriptional regulator
MEMKIAAEALAALALEGRLAVFRLLVQAGPEGVKAGDIALALGAPASTLSANLAVLSHAGLIEGRREGRSIRYSARYEQMRALIAFLLEDCCNGAPEICVPLMEIASRAACCESSRKPVQ